jgi:CDP-diglyceride synthetase
LWSLIQKKIDISHGGFELLMSLCSTFLIFGVPAELTAVVLGLPCWLIYRRFRISSPVAYALGGALISQIVMFLLLLTGSLLFLTGREGLAGIWQGLPLSLLCGVASALLFRTMALDLHASQVT